MSVHHSLFKYGDFCTGGFHKDVCIAEIVHVFLWGGCDIRMGWLRFVGSLKSYVSFAEYRLFYRALLQKRRLYIKDRLYRGFSQRRLYIRDRPYILMGWLRFVTIKLPPRRLCIKDGKYIYVELYMGSSEDGSYIYMELQRRQWSSISVLNQIATKTPKYQR